MNDQVNSPKPEEKNKETKKLISSIYYMAAIRVNQFLICQISFSMFLQFLISSQSDQVAKPKLDFDMALLGWRAQPETHEPVLEDRRRLDGRRMILLLWRRQSENEMMCRFEGSMKVETLDQIGMTNHRLMELLKMWEGPLQIRAAASVATADAVARAVELEAQEWRDGLVSRRVLLADSPPARYYSSKCCHHTDVLDTNEINFSLFMKTFFL